jgi:hypothetical protein
MISFFDLFLIVPALAGQICIDPVQGHPEPDLIALERCLVTVSPPIFNEPPSEYGQTVIEDGGVIYPYQDEKILHLHRGFLRSCQVPKGQPMSSSALSYNVAIEFEVRGEKGINCSVDVDVKSGSVVRIDQNYLSGMGRYRKIACQDSNDQIQRVFLLRDLERRLREFKPHSLVSAKRVFAACSGVKEVGVKALLLNVLERGASTSH